MLLVALYLPYNDFNFPIIILLSERPKIKFPLLSMDNNRRRVTKISTDRGKNINRRICSRLARLSKTPLKLSKKKQPADGLFSF